ncbi:MAG: hypothetical protein K6348_04320 [Deferribacterales bacterium]
MRKVFRYFLIFILLFTGCGYRISGISNNEGLNTFFYIERVVNLDPESSYYGIIDEEVNKFFTNHGLKKDDKADVDHFFAFILERAKTSSSITNVTNQTVQADMIVRVVVNVYNKNNKNIFSKNYLASSTFSVTPNISQNKVNNDNALRRCLRDILNDFLYDFKKTVK